ncbi:MAG: protein O-mannosyl-transferase family [Candidatus Xenobia bacterium]
MQEKQQAWVAGGSVALVALVVYLLTLCPTVSPLGDAGELALAAWTLGVAHPPGYPLFVLLGHLFTLIPLGTVAARVNFFAAVCGAGGAGFAAAALSVWGFELPVAVASALALAFDLNVWEIAVCSEVRTLYFLLAAVLLWLVALWWRDRPTRLLPWMGLAIGLGFSAHYNFIVVAGATIIILLAQRWRPSPAFAGGLVAGLLPYAALPLMARRDPWLNWGNPATLQGWLGVIMRRDYGGVTHLAGDVTVRPFSLLNGIGHWAASLCFGFTPVLCLLGLIGLGLLWRNHRSLALLVTVELVLLGPAYVIALHVPDVPMAWSVFVRQFTACWLVFAIALAAGLQPLHRRIGWGCVAIAVLPLCLNWHLATEHTLRMGEQFGRDLLTSLPPNAVLFTDSDAALDATWYLQGVEGLRPDVLLIPRGACHQPWFQEQLQRRHAAEVAGYNWSQLAAEDRPVSLALFLLQRRPVFLDQTWPGLDDRLIEQGVVYQVAADPRQMIAAKPDEVLAHFTAPSDDRAMWQVHPLISALPGSIGTIAWHYADGEMNLGVALGQRAKFDLAERAFRDALRIDPEMPVAHFNLGYLLAGRNQTEDAMHEYQLAVRYNPKYSDAWIALADLYARAGRTAEAEHARRQATFH